MVFSTAWLALAARAPAELCQSAPRPGQRPRQRLRADEVLRALFVPPAQELERLADCLYAFFCLPLPEPSGQYWVPRRPGVLYSYRRSLSVSSSSSSSSSSSWTDSAEEGLLYYSDG